MRALVVGPGGREDCLVWKLSQSALIDGLYCAPGNGGTAQRCKNIDIAANDIDSLLNFALKENIDLTIVGPEAPLVSGIVDAFQAKGLKIFGPDKRLAKLEGSKSFAKEFMKKYAIPTSEFAVFDNPARAKEYIDKGSGPLVVKADGLAAGKGVIVCKTKDEAVKAVDLIMVEKRFGEAGKSVVIEEYLSGQEASILIFSDGNTYVPLVSSQDHKPVYDGDSGPNTGGMGAYSPAPLVSGPVLQKINDTIFRPLTEGLKKEGKIYKGILYAGLMIKDNNPYVLEFNVRFGDPETQAILPKLKSDLAEVILAAVAGKLQDIKLDWDPRFCICVVLASGGYPGSYQKGKEIKGLNNFENSEDVFVFHAGTQAIQHGTGQEPEFVTNGGRVLNVVALGATIKEAKSKVYDAVKKINFENMHYRRDIGNKALKFSTCSVE